MALTVTERYTVVTGPRKRETVHFTQSTGGGQTGEFRSTLVRPTHARTYYVALDNNTITIVGITSGTIFGDDGQGIAVATFGQGSYLTVIDGF